MLDPDESILRGKLTVIQMSMLEKKRGLKSTSAFSFRS